MNAERLLEHYDRIGDAPEAIPRLRRYILDLAVRGKLVPQDLSDEPASEMLKRIAKEKARLVKAGKLKGPSEIPTIETDEAWPVPDCWSFIPLEALSAPNGIFTDGDWVESKDQDPLGNVRLVQLADVGLGEFRDRSARFMNAATAARLNCTFLERGDILIARMPDPLGRACIFPGDNKASVTVVDVAILRLGSAYFDAAFVVHAINSPQFTKNVAAKAAGTTRSRISRGNLNQLPFPFPPLAEQRRIVAKVDELMSLCNRLEAARVGREAVRDRLAAASLARLNAPDPDPAAFADHARFALDNLAALTTRPDQVKQLRQTILNLAVRGKLVLQDPNDEPASELLKRIAKEKARLVKEGKVKKEKPLYLIDDATKPYDLPDAWEWVRLDVLTQLITKGSSPKWQGVNYVSADEGILFITSENVGNYELRKLDDLKYVELRFRGIEPRSMLKTGDILMNLVGASIGRTALYNLKAEANINQAVALVRLIKMHEGPYVDYLLHYFNSRSAIEFMLGSRVTTAQPNMSLTDAREFPVPLPPLAEQHRIVAKIDALMALCDQLEASLDTTAATRRRLLDALLAEALAPINQRDAA
jgi:type I restriction enzyme S subunit